MKLWYTPAEENMAESTDSEALFEDLCDRLGWVWSRVEEAELEGYRRPDYWVRLGQNREVIVEVKQFDPNPQERQQLQARVAAYRSTPGDRIRKAIRSGAPQLKALSEGKRAAILVVYDNTGSMMHTDPYAVLTAMRGLDVVDVAVPADPNQAPTFGPLRPGPKKKLTATSHTTVSAIAVLRIREDGPSLEIYHNRHAVNPLRPAEVGGERVTNLRMKPDESDWEVVET